MTTDITKRDDMDIGIEMSDLMMIMMMLIFASLLPAIATSTAQTAQVMTAMVYEGKRVEKTIVVTDQLCYVDFVTNPPYKPLVGVDVDNDGPNGVWWSVNNPDDRYWINAGSSDGADRVMSIERISTLFFRCRGGETTVVRMSGEY